MEGTDTACGRLQAFHATSAAETDLDGLLGNIHEASLVKEGRELLAALKKELTLATEAARGKKRG